MKLIAALILSLTLSAFADRPAWVDSPQTTWSDSGKIFIKIRVINKDLDQGMNSTKSRFKEEIAAHFCHGDEGSPCMYFNFTIEKSYWEVIPWDDTTKFDIYRLFSIKDIYSN
jgi:hypothetical protein